MSKNIVDDTFLSMLDGLSLYLNKNMDGLFGGGRKSDKKGNTVEFADYREYVIGDELKKIDWNIYARFEKLYVKLFNDERQVTNHIYIDTSKSMNYGKPDKGEVALKYAAALGYLSVIGLDRVVFKQIIDDKCVDVGGIINNKESFYIASKLLSNVKFRRSIDINQAIRNNIDLQVGKGLSVIISDFLTESDWKSAIDYLVYNKRQVLVLHLLAPEEFEPYYSGKVKLIDSEIADETDERHLKLEIGKRAIKSYIAAFESYIEEIQSFCNSRNVDYMLINCGEPIEDVLLTKGYERGLVK